MRPKSLIEIVDLNTKTGRREAAKDFWQTGREAILLSILFGVIAALALLAG